jgi:hypothetical protein
MNTQARDTATRSSIFVDAGGIVLENNSRDSSTVPPERSPEWDNLNA